MSESSTMRTSEHCVGLRKYGKPCHGVGTIFDPDLNEMVCEWHTGPQINQQRESRLYAHDKEKYEAAMRSLSDQALDMLLRDLRHFRTGKPLTRKTSEMLHMILSGEVARMNVRRFTRKHDVM
jgi:hypothetical protein